MTIIALIRPLTILAYLTALVVPAAAQTPVEIDTLTQEGFAACREAGGNPSVQAEYLTTAELNGDDTADFVVNFAGLQCENAWSYFCGSGGCPVSVWLSTREGYAVAWQGYAQNVGLDGKVVVVSLHGQFCDPPRTGADGCQERLTFNGAAPPASGAVLAEPLPGSGTIPPVPPAADRWELRMPPNSSAVAVIGGTGNLRNMAAFCLGGAPWLALSFNTAPSSDTVHVVFSFSGGTIGGPAQRQASTGGAFVIGLAGHELASLLAGRDARVGLIVDGQDLGTISLSGSTRALRRALVACHTF